jgi:hypothetical protein
MKTVLTGYDISSACIAAFRVLKSVVHRYTLAIHMLIHPDAFVFSAAS